ncbi:MAG: sn-glycerol-1-phosphate dehydrogenase [Limnochordia bacterium]|jgi:glycerol-1-phosphate dehydrogenase [NAD(P)+]|nr:sn-glycerol-1-phosphate dehydrogenase [Bacillota bacterium]
MALEPVDLGHYLNRPIACECGRTHFAGIEAVEISDGAMGKLADLIRRGGYQKPFIVADKNTAKIAGGQVLEILFTQGMSYSSFVFDDAALSPDEDALGRLLINFDADCDLIVAVGSGTINDISRFFSHRLGLPYFIVATAPSMDGYASSVAPLLKNNLKTTFECHVPKAIIADRTILAEAPKDMIAAGFGDVVGKYTALTDWKLSAIINGEYYCERVAKLTRESLERTIRLREGIAAGDRGAIGELMETLILSGVAISYVENSRPASGSEHHLAHFWEMRLLWEGGDPILHGTGVGIGTVSILRLYQMLLGDELDPRTFLHASALEKDQWALGIRKAFLKGAEEVLALEERVKKNDPALCQKRRMVIAEHWDEILRTLTTVPSPSRVQEYLQTVGAPFEPAQAGLGLRLVFDALVYAKEIRPRYTILQLLGDLGLLEHYAQQLIKAGDAHERQGEGGLRQ